MFAIRSLMILLPLALLAVLEAIAALHAAESPPAKPSPRVLFRQPELRTPFETPFSIELIGDPHGWRGEKLKAALHAEPLVAGAAPPNVLIVMADDQGYGKLSAHGNPVLKTPNLDRLRGESVRFTDFHGQEIAGAYYVTVERLDKDTAKTTREATSSADSNPRPNIVLIVADDLGYGDVGCYGSTKIRTPHMDRLAADGVRFTDAHSTAAVCNPSRYAILAGTYLHHAKRANDYSLYFHDGQITLPSLLQSAGYRTAALGKWHNGFGRKGDPDYNAELKPGPLEIGFDSFFGTPRTHNEPPWVFVENHRVVGWDPADPIRIISHDEVLRRSLKDYGWGISEGAANAHAARPDERIDLIIAEKAAAFLSRSPKATPFFLYIAFAAPHSPVNPAPEFRGRSQAGIYGDYVEQLDHCVGRVLDALDACGAARDTLVLVTSDNGAVGTRGAIAAGHRSNGVLLGQKTDAWEGGHRVPLIARWPGRIPAGSERKALFTQIDIMATLAAAARVELPPGASPDGMSDLAAFSDPGRAPAKRTEALFQGTGSYALRQGDWLYIPRQGSGGMTVQVPPRPPWGLPYAEMNQRNSDIDPQGKVQLGAPSAQLYNLREDLTQTTNRFRDQPATAERLAARMEELLPKPKRPGKR